MSKIISFQFLWIAMFFMVKIYPEENVLKIIFWIFLVTISGRIFSNQEYIISQMIILLEISHSFIQAACWIFIFPLHISVHLELRIYREIDLLKTGGIDHHNKNFNYFKKIHGAGNSTRELKNSTSESKYLLGYKSTTEIWDGISCYLSKRTIL